MKLALAMIVKASDDEADHLANCLRFIAPYVDEIFITITGKNSRVREVAELYGANISYFEWINDFSAARNFNFSQVPKCYDYIMWLDADDAVRGADKIRETIEKNDYADVFVMSYMYAFDQYKNPIVVHLKSQIVRNDDCVEWVGALHEDFKANRNLESFYIKGIERIHLSNDARFEANKQRNVEVSREDLIKNPDDPRSYWNLGNSLKGAGKDKEAIECFNKFLEISQSEEEKYIVRLRRAESYWNLDDKKKAIEECQYALGLKPDYPDAYHLLGDLYYAMGRLKEASESYLRGLTKKPPYYKIIVYNPREYDYRPMMNLAKVYIELSRPDLALPLMEGCLKIQPQDERLKKAIQEIKKKTKEFDKIVKLVKRLEKVKDKNRLKKEIYKVPAELRSHPSICYLKNINFVKNESSGKDLVIYCGYTADEWNPEIARTKGIGGSEEAVIHLAQKFANYGWNVEVYNNCGYKEQKFGNVTYKPHWSWNFRDKQDVVILWRTPKACDYEINAGKILIDLHDVIPEGEFTEKRLKKIDKIFVKSNFHRSLFPNIPDDKFAIIPNGIDADVFSKDFKKDKYLLINTSSPDRSLGCLIDLFAEVKKQVPKAKLKWAYGWNVFDVSHSDNFEMMDWKQKILDKIKRTNGVEALGRISHEDVAKLYQEAQIFAYPTEFAEIHCISAVKAQAAGAIPVTTDFAALNETVQYGVKIHSEKNKDNWCPNGKFDFSLEDEKKKKQWVKEVVKMLKKPMDTHDMKKWAKETYDWNKIANEWIKYL